VKCYFSDKKLGKAIFVDSATRLSSTEDFSYRFCRKNPLEAGVLEKIEHGSFK
jgi:hypothetical protein